MATPCPTCYLNGAYLPLADARISPLDRGFLFADGVYEVVPVNRGRPFRLREHLKRLADSLRSIRIDNPHSDAEWLAIIARLASPHSAASVCRKTGSRRAPRKSSPASESTHCLPARLTSGSTSDTPKKP